MWTGSNGFDGDGSSYDGDGNGIEYGGEQNDYGAVMVVIMTNSGDDGDSWWWWLDEEYFAINILSSSNNKSSTDVPFIPITFGVWSQFFPNLFSGHSQKYVSIASRQVAPPTQGLESQNLWTVGAGGGGGDDFGEEAGGRVGGTTLGGPIVSKCIRKSAKTLI